MKVQEEDKFIKIDIFQFIERFEPIPINSDRFDESSIDMDSYKITNFSDPRIEYYKQNMPNHLWTVVDGSYQSIHNGFHYVNRDSYIITAKPWKCSVLVDEEYLKQSIEFICNNEDGDDISVYAEEIIDTIMGHNYDDDGAPYIEDGILDSCDYSVNVELLSEQNEALNKISISLLTLKDMAMTDDDLTALIIKAMKVVPSLSDKYESGNLIHIKTETVPERNVHKEYCKCCSSDDVVENDRTEENGSIFIEKECGDCGELWTDEFTYNRSVKNTNKSKLKI